MYTKRRKVLLKICDSYKSSGVAHVVRAIEVGKVAHITCKSNRIFWRIDNTSTGKMC